MVSKLLRRELCISEDFRKICISTMREMGNCILIKKLYVGLTCALPTLVWVLMSVAFPQACTAARITELEAHMAFVTNITVSRTHATSHCTAGKELHAAQA